MLSFSALLVISSCLPDSVVQREVIWAIPWGQDVGISASVRVGMLEGDCAFQVNLPIPRNGLA